MTDCPQLGDFEDWARENIGFTQNIRTWVESNVSTALLTVQGHEIVGLIGEYVKQNLASSKRKEINIIDDEVVIVSKSFSSIISKLYRMNIVENDNFPAPPVRGWITASNMFAEINDLVRTTVVCKHLNEPKIIADALCELGGKCGLKSRRIAQAKEHGYYAYHVYFSIPAELVAMNWDHFTSEISFEVQITTQMQYMLYELTHVFYDRERNVPLRDKNSWKWEYRSPKFSASYLSHTLHLLEGMIIRLYEDVVANGVASAHSAQSLAAPAQNAGQPTDSVSSK